MVRASQRDGAGPSKDILNSDDSVASARPYGEAVQSNVLYVTLKIHIVAWKIRSMSKWYDEGRKCKRLVDTGKMMFYSTGRLVTEGQ